MLLNATSFVTYFFCFRKIFRIKTYPVVQRYARLSLLHGKNISQVSNLNWLYVLHSSCQFSLQLTTGCSWKNKFYRGFVVRLKPAPILGTHGTLVRARCTWISSLSQD